MKDIKKFVGKYYYLSNYYPCKVTYNGYTYKSSESAYQAQKSMYFHTFKELDADRAKQLAKHLPLREDWEDVKDDFMYEIVREKFEQNPRLKRKLIRTRNAYLEEGTEWGDIYWGTYKGVGENHLGKILMRVRAELMV